MLRVFPNARPLLVMALLAVPAAQTLGAQQPTAPKAAAILEKTAKVLAATKAFSFTLAAKQISPGMRLGGVAQGTGTAVAPDKLLFSGTMQQTPALAMSFALVSCGSTQYIEVGDGQFQPMGGLPNIGRLLFAPDTNFVRSVLEHLDKPSPPHAMMLEGTPIWHITGTIPSTILALVPSPAAGSQTPVRAELWIGQQDSRLRQLILNGAMFQGDSASTMRVLTFSHFDEKLTFTVPRGTAPCQP